MSLLTHVRVDVTGSSEEREAYRLRVADLLTDEPFLVEERHSREQLGYDLKVQGGIPFPPFVTASLGLPGVTVTVEWVNAQTNERGSTTIIDGRLQTTSVSARGAVADLGPELSFAAVDNVAGLRLAFVCVRLAPDEYGGYAISGDRDAAFRARRDPQTDRGELRASAGSAEWSERWTFDLKLRQCESEETAPEPIDEAEYDALAALAEAFAAEWIWFADRPQEEIAIERVRYQQLGIPVRAANLRTAKLRGVQQSSEGTAKRWQWSRLDSEAEWVREILERCWAAR